MCVYKNVTIKSNNKTKKHQEIPRTRELLYILWHRVSYLNIHGPQLFYWEASTKTARKIVVRIKVKKMRGWGWAPGNSLKFSFCRFRMGIIHFWTLRGSWVLSQSAISGITLSQRSQPECRLWRWLVGSVSSVATKGWADSTGEEAGRERNGHHDKASSASQCPS